MPIREANVHLIWFMCLWIFLVCGPGCGKTRPILGGGEQVARSPRSPQGVGSLSNIGEVRTFQVEMVLVPSGDFIMGWDDGPEDQRPRRIVYLNTYYIDKYEVTNAEYYKFWVAKDGGDRTRHTPAGHGSKDGIGDWPDVATSKPNYPVVGVTWFDAETYCRWRGARLPTEAEWEKAARGHEGREPYPWNRGINGSRANYRDGDDGYDNTLAPVGSYPEGVSFYGALDLVGNVWEWCADYYDPNYYKVGSRVNPSGPETGAYRVFRGGSWRTSAGQMPDQLRVTYRGWMDPRGASDGWGIRCARDVR